MSVSMSSRDASDLGVTTIMSTHDVTPSVQVDSVYELDRCQQWIKSQSLSRVALQFPDSLLQDAHNVTSQLQARLVGVSLYVLGDTTFGECCVDEIAAEHYTSQGVIHFGHTCLTPTAKLPALWIFTKKLLDVESLKQQLQEKYSGDSRRVILVYDVEYDHIMNNITVDNVNLAVGLCQNSEKGLRKFGRSFPGLPSEEDLKNAVIVYVGGKDSVLMNIVYNCPDNEFMVFENNSLVSAQVPGSKLMMKRYFLVEKAKDATRVGLLVGTLGTQQYTEIIERMKKVGKVAKKKMYVFLVGKPNVAKLANFPEVDVFVLVACPESSIVDSKDFLQPIITPFEFELACGNTEWTGNLLTDFKDVIAKNFECNAECVESDVSLISGKIRVSSLEDESSSGGELSVINDKTISLLHEGGGGSFLAGRSWSGLEQKLGQTKVGEVVEGRMGVAAGYEGEGQQS